MQAGVWRGGGQGRKDVLSQRGSWQPELCGAWVRVGPVWPNVPAHGGWKRWVSPIINCPEYQLPADGTVLPQGGNGEASLSGKAEGSCWLRMVLSGEGPQWGPHRAPPQPPPPAAELLSPLHPLDRAGEARGPGRPASTTQARAEEGWDWDPDFSSCWPLPHSFLRKKFVTEVKVWAWGASSSEAVSGWKG